MDLYEGVLNWSSRRYEFSERNTLKFRLKEIVRGLAMRGDPSESDFLLSVSLPSDVKDVDRFAEGIHLVELGRSIGRLRPLGLVEEDGRTVIDFQYVPGGRLKPILGSGRLTA
ncbi:hypothetical protein HOF78_00735 [Candidatus Woesearchaeota archaeon]|jgi:hypothetical protein|nr:hypothetical protein [Candidatus Woesearchaeota archaeon]MBT6044427.1 hypothetical protein [Candidatus Woesearchaeota archaeon]